MKNYLFARNIDLDSKIVTNTHNYAFQCAKTNSTKWLSTPNYPWSSRKEYKGGQLYKNIEDIKLSFLFNHGARFLNSSKLIFESFPYSNYISRLTDSIDYESIKGSDVFFCGSLSLFSIQKIIKPKKLVYNAHDLFAFYPNAPKSFKRIEASIIEKADLVVTTSEMTKKVLTETYGSKKIINLNHGVNLEDFEFKGIPKDLPKTGLPIAIYVGTVSKLDKEFMKIVAGLLPEVSFVFIGPYTESDKLEYHSCKNVYLLGSKNRNELGSYYKTATVGLINEKQELKDNRLLGTNPMKRYDYSAAGLQIVSTSLREYEVNPSPMYITDNPYQYAGFIEAAIISPKYNKEEIMELSKCNLWKDKFLKVEECLF